MLHFTTFHNVSIYVKCQQKLVINVNFVAQKSEKVAASIHFRKESSNLKHVSDRILEGLINRENCRISHQIHQIRVGKPKSCNGFIFDGI